MSRVLEIDRTPLAGLCVLRSKRISDHRGCFYRIFSAAELQEILDDRVIVQANVSVTHEIGTVRGLHYQMPPDAEAKIVRCVSGAVWDVAVDLRKNSPTYLRWHAEELRPERANALYIPEGFAHGFQVLQHDSILVYMHTAAYAPQSEAGLPHDDPALGIQWPLPVRNLSERDAGFTPLEVNGSMPPPYNR